MISDLRQTAQKMVTPGKGILASDERSGSLNKKFAKLGIPQTLEMRRRYRELIITTPGIEKYLNAVILSEETMQQESASHVPFPQILQTKGILPGVKVDGGTIDLVNFPDERVTEGLDGLSEKLVFYKTLGAAFAKWRAVIVIDTEKGLPSKQAIVANAHVLARYASICQQEGVVPIVEPEVLHKGTHSLDHCATIITQALQEVFSQLTFYGVDLSGIILKTSMALSGSEVPQESPQEVASATVATLKETVPDSVPGVVFLSGGQTPEEATQNLSAIVQYQSLPWEVSFSYLRAIQQPMLDTWKGDQGNADQAREALIEQLERVKCAEEGKYPAQC